MPNLTKLAHHLDPKTGVCRAVIETPKGRRSKFDYDPKSKLFRLKSLLPEGMSFPLDFGFIPSTLGDDGDPLDVMVMADEATCVGALLDVRLIGVIEAQEVEHGRKERNDRLIAVCTQTCLYAQIASPKDLPETFIDHLAQFWTVKDRMAGKAFTVLGVREPAEAIRLVQAGGKAFEKAA